MTNEDSGISRPGEPPSRAWLEQFYDEYPRIERAFSETLSTSLHPRGPNMLFEVVAEMGLATGARVVDVGCGEGRDAVELAERFGFDVLGVDPLPRHVEVATALASRRAGGGERGGGARFLVGTAEGLPIDDGSVDLVWCRDVLVHVADAGAAYAEFERVLRPGGRGIVYQTFATERLEPREAGWLWRTMGVVPESADPARARAGLRGSGLRLDQEIDLRSEWGEWADEHSGQARRRLLHAARLLRDPERYIRQFGQAAYDTMLGDCLWHVYAMIGKLDRVVLVFSKP